MTRVAVLEISDLALTLFRGDQLVHSEPCFATYDGQWQFGQTAQYQQRKKPRESESRYFARLNTDPLTQPLGGVGVRLLKTLSQIRLSRGQYFINC